ncbi:hypothetical protein GN330_22535 [Nitratireductor sp. CAU 1489]|uniref:Uncharacterized protein n=1 Tax=Nitratireductor arenosus TaxID=2682096 RepID=A0A844QQE2_9HYPH|nr:hypothetical protein [Nitratireductor arenosus]MVB00032.1 hypothetical protein [Nitratireductor arenosus]
MTATAIERATRAIRRKRQSPLCQLCDRTKNSGGSCECEDWARAAILSIRDVDDQTLPSGEIFSHFQTFDGSEDNIYIDVDRDEARVIWASTIDAILKGRKA